MLLFDIFPILEIQTIFLFDLIISFTIQWAYWLTILIVISMLGPIRISFVS
jgi:hypothetical protein